MKANIREMLIEGSKVSLMRWALLQIIRMSYLIVLGILAHIVIATLKAEVVDWVGVGVALTGLAAFIGAGVAGKAVQKKVEVK